MGGSVAPAVAATATKRVGLRDLLPYLRDHRWTLLAVVVVALFGALASLAQPLLTREVLRAVGDQRGLLVPVAALVGVAVAAAAAGGIRGFLLQRTAEGIVLAARGRLAGRLLRLPIAEYDRRRTGDLLSRVGADTTLLRAVVTSGLFESASGVVVLVGAVVAMALLDPLMLGITVLAVGTGVSVAVTVARRVRNLSEQAQAKVGEMTASVERALTAVRTIRASRAEEREVGVVVGSAEAAYTAGLRAARLEALVGPAVTIAVQGSFVLVLGVGGARVASGAMTVADLVAFVLYMFLLVLPLAQALRAYTTLQTGLGALQRINDVLELPHESGVARVTTTGAAEPTSAVPVAPMIELSDVQFAYDDGTAVLHGVSFAVPRGTRTALVGPSGAGKSTILALVERFYDVTGGSVRVNGTDVRAQPRTELRRHIGYVEQEAPVLAGTLRDNLRLTVPDATDEDLHAVVGAVNLTGLVHRAPDGLDSEVGDNGVLLSGGERQRLAIARALLAAPPLLLLDEPTSNLDARNEAALRRAVDAVSVNRTLLTVAHRLSTVVDADQIVVLDAGRVVAVGRHDELVDSSALYRELATQQLLAG